MILIGVLRPVQRGNLLPFSTFMAILVFIMSQGDIIPGAFLGLQIEFYLLIILTLISLSQT